MEGAEEVSGRVGHRQVLMVDKFDLRHLFWFGVLLAARHQYALHLRARHAIYSQTAVWAGSGAGRPRRHHASGNVGKSALNADEEVVF
jgi:hypothetical protein